jgi:hypothetical protein
MIRDPRLIHRKPLQPHWRNTDAVTGNSLVLNSAIAAQCDFDFTVQAQYAF